MSEQETEVFGGYFDGCDTYEQDIFQTSDNVGIYYKRLSRRGPPIILLHGIDTAFSRIEGGCYAYGKETSDTSLFSLLSRSFEMITPDMRGHGFSEKNSSKDFTLHRLARDVDELKSHLNITQAYFLCMSYGCSILLQYMINYGLDSILGAVLSEAFGSIPVVDGEYDERRGRRQLYYQSLVVPYNEELSLSVNRAHSDALFSRYLLFKSILAANDTRVRHGPFLSMRLPTDIKVKMMNNPGPSQAVTPEMLGYLPRVGLFYGRYSYEYGKSALALKEMRNSITMECPLCRVEIFDAGHIIEADASVEFVEKIVDILLK